MAATTLSGFLQCSFLSMDPPMQAHFEALCKTRLPKKRKRELGSIVDTIPSAGGPLNHWLTSAQFIVISITSFPLVDLVRRHAGVLGLSACILSSPYDVPTWMPQLLMDLSAHLNDTQPIEVSASSAAVLLALTAGDRNVMLLSRWPWRKRCQTSGARTTTTGSSISSSSRTTSCWCWPTCWSPPVTTPEPW